MNNIQKEKQRVMEMKIRVFEKEKLDEFRMAKKKGDQTRVKRILGDILWMRNKDKTLTRTLVGKIERRNNLKHQSLEKLVNHF